MPELNRKVACACRGRPATTPHSTRYQHMAASGVADHHRMVPESMGGGLGRRMEERSGAAQAGEETTFGRGRGRDDCATLGEAPSSVEMLLALETLAARSPSPAATPIEEAAAATRMSAPHLSPTSTLNDARAGHAPHVHALAAQHSFSSTTTSATNTTAGPCGRCSPHRRMHATQHNTRHESLERVA
jgi:hypothetical protein